MAGTCWKCGCRLLPALAVVAISCSRAVAASSSTASSSSGTTSTSTSSTCNLTMYEQWYDTTYAGSLTSSLSAFWLFSDAELTNGQAMEVASTSCSVMMGQLRLDRAGRHGPVGDKYIYDVMCSDECLGSDLLREDGMATSGCECLELSTQPEDPTFHQEGDWCLANTGRILCDVFDQCGRWSCRIGDFMCPRYEYNKFRVSYRGLGDCSAAYKQYMAPGMSSLATVVIGLCVLALTRPFLPTFQ